MLVFDTNAIFVFKCAQQILLLVVVIRVGASMTKHARHCPEGFDCFNPLDLQNHLLK